MKAVNYSINDYGNFIDFGSGLITEGEDFFRFKRIDETKGIIDDYLSIIDELYSEIVKTEQVPFNDENFYTSYSLSDYEMKQDCFIKSLTLVVLTKSKINSYFNGNNSEISNDDKLFNFNLVIGIEDVDINSNKGKDEFYSEMSHELQHIYRFYCILLSNNSNYKDEENKKMWRNRNATKVMNGQSEDTLQNKINTLYYLSDKNEISSETNRLYEYIRAHNEINDFSYYEFEESLPLYKLIINLKNGIKVIDEHIKDNDFVSEYGNICKAIVGDDKNTPSKALIKFRTRLIYGAMFAERNYKRTLSKAFKDFNRYSKQNKNPFNEIIDFGEEINLLNEIINRGKIK